MLFCFQALRVSMEEQRARQEQEARRSQATSGAEAKTSRPETINESKKKRDIMFLSGYFSFNIF